MSSNLSYKPGQHRFMATAIAGLFLLAANAAAQDVPQLPPLPEPMTAAEAAPALPLEAPAGMAVEQTTVTPDTANAPVVPEQGEEVQTESPDASLSGSTPNFDVSSLWKGSLSYTEQQINDILAVREAYLLKMSGQGTDEVVEEGSNVDDILKGLEVEQQIPEPIIIETLQLTFNSILFYSPSDWSIWINGRGYSRKQSLRGIALNNNTTIKVTNVSKERATFIWKPNADTFPIVKERYEASKRRKGTPMTPQIVKEQRVFLNDTDEAFSITLRPNQTFSSALFAVIEGKITASTQAAIMASDPGYFAAPAESEPAEAADSAQNPAMPISADDKLRNISTGLMNQYMQLAPLVGQPAPNTPNGEMPAMPSPSSGMPMAPPTNVQ